MSVHSKSSLMNKWLSLSVLWSATLNGVIHYVTSNVEPGVIYCSETGTNSLNHIFSNMSHQNASRNSNIAVIIELYTAIDL